MFKEPMKAVLNSARSFLILALLAGVASGADAPALKPPPGARVAIVMFEDMECPSCAANYPRVEEAGKTHNVPVVLRDFPLGPGHPWSFEAAVWARFFDSQSEAAGRDFRAYIFRNQPKIIPGNLRQFVQRFADQNHIALPFANDPEGKLKAKVQADHDLGMSLGVKETPTVFVVSNTETRKVDSLDNLSQIVQDIQQKTPAPATPAKSPTKKKAA
jgi:protein-disulfide isomerase